MHSVSRAQGHTIAQLWKRNNLERTSGTSVTATVNYSNLLLTHENLTLLSVQNQHMLVKIQLFLVWMHLYSQIFMFLWSSMHICLKPPKTNKQTNPNSQCQTQQQTHKNHLVFPSIHCQCYLHSGCSDHKIQGKKKWQERVMANDAADYHSWVVRLAELCPLLCFSINGKPPYTPVNIIKNPLNSLKVLQSSSW